MRFKLSYLLAAWMLFQAGIAHAVDDTNPKSVGLPRIEGLTWTAQRFEAIDEYMAGTHIVATLTGRFQHKDWHLYYNGKGVDLSDDPKTAGQFTLIVPIHGKVGVFRLVAQGPLGSFQAEELVIFVARPGEAAGDPDSRDILPNIMAEVFPVSPVKKTENDEYVFDDPKSENPPVGNLLLLRTSKSAIAVVRVTERRSKERQFVAKVVRIYGKGEALQVGTEYQATEKVADVIWAIAPRDGEFDRNIFSFSVDAASISYAVTSQPSFSEIAMVAQLGYQLYLDRPELTLNLSAYSTVFPVTTTSNATGTGLSLRGASAGLGYRTSMMDAPWSLLFEGGVSWATLSGSAAVSGFQNVLSPQLYPVLRRMFVNGDALYLSAQYNPVGSAFDFSQSELAGSISYEHALVSGNAWNIHLHASNLTYTPAEESSLTLKTYSLGFGYRF